MQGGAPPYRDNPIRTVACGWTQIGPFKMDTKALLIACCFCKTLASSFDRAAKRPQPYTIWRESTHASKVPTKETLKPEAVRTLNKLPKSVITSQRSQPTTEGHPLKRITQLRLQQHYDYSSQSAVAGFPQPSEGNNKICGHLNLKASKRTKFPSPAELVELIFKIKIVKFSACDFLRRNSRN